MPFETTSKLLRCTNKDSMNQSTDVKFQVIHNITYNICPVGYTKKTKNVAGKNESTPDLCHDNIIVMFLKSIFHLNVSHKTQGVK